MTHDPSDTTIVTSAANAAARAHAASTPFALTDRAGRADALLAVADALAADADTLVPVGMRETGLAEARLRGELNRTVVQLRLFADTVRAGDYLDVRIDEADPGFALGARPDLRRYLVPVGPVVNFAASNFPFAFSVAGGDTAAALAAGCPVILKAHPGHPELSRLTAQVVVHALTEADMPDGTFQLIEGQDAGIEALRDPRVAAGSFTGSLNAGRALADIAASRPAPIPFFGELGSVNPVFVTAGGLVSAGGADALAAGFVASVAGSAGQLCTKPGFLFVPTGALAQLDAPIREAAEAAHRLLYPKITSGYVERRDTILGVDGVRAVASGSVEVDDDGHGWVTPTIVAVDLDTLRSAGEDLLDEAFGPLSIVVEYDPATTDLAALVPDLFPGSLTATVYAGDTEQTPDLDRLVFALSRHAGRVLFGGWPTGVAVTPAMQHGGPWPATTNDSSTSVGTAALLRFLRPVAFQSAPDRMLPLELRDDNPSSVPRATAPAGESTSWGSTSA
jgi:acyl-CoA reductase-like NAD-dependent aldehyde dehydrogenase